MLLEVLYDKQQLKRPNSGCHQSSVDLFAPTILGSNPKHAINAFYIYSHIWTIFVERTIINKKEAGLDPYLKRPNSP